MTVMIDWVSARVPLDWDLPITAGSVIHVRPDNTVERRLEKHKLIEGSFSSTFAVRTVERGAIQISGNPSKFLQGHNLFGSSDLHSLVLATISKLCEALQIIPKASDIHGWRFGATIELSRVDIAAMYELPSRADVRGWLQAAAEGTNVRWRGRGHFDSGTLMFGKVEKGKRASRWQAVLYCKGDEIEKPRHQIPDCIPGYEDLISFADNKLRIEFRLRTPELTSTNTRQLASWNLETAQTLHGKYLSKIQLSDVTMSQEKSVDLKPRYQAVYALWKTGADCRKLYPKKTFYRYRNAIMDAIDCDIACPAPTSNVVPLRRILEAVPAAVPEHLTYLMFKPEPYLRLAS